MSKLPWKPWHQVVQLSPDVCTGELSARTPNARCPAENLLVELLTIPERDGLATCLPSSTANWK